MPYVNPIWLEGRRRYWQRHDWQRYLTPAGLAEHQRAEEEAKLAARRKAEAAEQEEMRETLLWLRRELAEVKFALAMRRIAHKYDPDQPRAPKGDPDGGQWVRDAGKAGGDDRSRSTDLSAARRASSRRSQTTQEIQRDQARGRAQQAIERVRQLDPDWQPRTVSLTKPDSIEGAIRHNEAITREAEARFVALSRVGLDTNWPRRDPTPFRDVLAPGGQLAGVRDPSVGEDARTVTPKEFESIRSELMIGARVANDPRYAGVRYQREDGSAFGLRLSRDHGLTLDVIESNTPALIRNGFRIHQR
jgi:hypothetical protein